MFDCVDALAVEIRAQSNNIGISENAPNLIFATRNISIFYGVVQICHRHGLRSILH